MTEGGNGNLPFLQEGEQEKTPPHFVTFIHEVFSSHRRGMECLISSLDTQLIIGQSTGLAFERSGNNAINLLGGVNGKELQYCVLEGHK